MPRGRKTAAPLDRKGRAASERIQKLLARAGLGSRREIEQWIAAGRVLVNGRRAELGARISITDHVTVDGRRVELQQTMPAVTRVLAYYKPAGEICTRSDPEGRTSVFDRLPRLRRGQWIGIGRLDYNTAGLLLFTSDGDLAHGLMHPSSEIEREYAVRVLGRASAAQIGKLSSGVVLDDGRARFAAIAEAGGEGANHWYHVVLTEGRKREVRRLWEAVGLKVSRLMRIRYGSCRLPRDRKPGEYWDLSAEEIQDLRRLAGRAGKA